MLDSVHPAREKKKKKKWKKKKTHQRAAKRKFQTMDARYINLGEETTILEAGLGRKRLEKMKSLTVAGAENLKSQDMHRINKEHGLQSAGTPHLLLVTVSEVFPITYRD
ncbi:Hypothetical predicted protein [Xyrichtys novacula]|uniref:Uncharacterized protein n=1 Tax=Xyrichtys novacula TaxID=13765 RepID=A0AAV1HB95_XYRNO|nr:Hypothetical predicted protein [Xyrichtys novacula]